MPLHLTVAEHLTAAIDKGRIPAGGRLPTEHELAAEFGVSRNVIREAIACLRADGIVDSRQGVGAFALPPHERQAVRIDSKNLSAAEMRDLFELRALLETEAAGLAAQRADPGQVGLIAATLRRLQDASADAQSTIEADMDFHRAIAQAAGNGYLLSFLDLVSQAVRASIFQASEANGSELIARSALEEHTPIYDAIAAADPVGARLAMQRHIRGAADRIGMKLK